MNFNDFLELEPMKYWSPPKGNDYDKEILREPEKFSHYTFTPKMDGEWNKLMWDGTHMYMLARNRNVNGIFLDRWEKFPHIIKNLIDLPPYTILLGEIAYDDITKTSKDVGSIMRSLVPRALKIQEQTPLHFFVFDCLMWKGEDLSGLSYLDRYIKNDELFEYFKNKNVDTAYAHLLVPQSMSTLVEYLTDYFKQGGEGVVLIDKNSKYSFGSRPVRASVKIKKTTGEFEAQVLSTLEPNKIYEGKELDSWQYFKDGEAVTKPYFYGWKNAIRCLYDGRTFDVASGLSDADREWLATEEAQQLIQAGKLYAVVSAMELTKDSVRHPYLVRLRTDM
jgi:ATP-dependent DNA ligase